MPSIGYGEANQQIYWKPPVYHTVLAILTNPMYAGAYAFGRTEARTKVIAGRARRTIGHTKPRDQWTVLLRDHHSGYISWEQFELNQKMLAENAHMKSRMGRQRGRGGSSLLVGLMRCGRCGRMLRVHYFKKRRNLRYLCVNGHINQGTQKCISFGGMRADQAVSKEILKVIQPTAIDAALRAAEQIQQQQSNRVRTLRLETRAGEVRSTARKPSVRIRRSRQSIGECGVRGSLEHYLVSCTGTGEPCQPSRGPIGWSNCGQRGIAASG
jgi:hypothetical protein